MKSVGIIGGLGPETTAEFYLEVLFGCEKLNSEQRPLVVVSSVPLSFEIERDFLSAKAGAERYLPLLIQEAKRLEASGVDFLVMPCNSLHVLIEDLREAVNIPVLSIVEETIKHLKAHNIEKVGIVSTSATAKNKLYESAAQAVNMATIMPNELQAIKLNEVIQRLVAGKHLNKDRNFINEVVDDLVGNGAQAVALACTDLQILVPAHGDIKVFDTMRILAKATIDTILESSSS